MLQQGETDAAGSEACMAFWAPICAESWILRGAARRAVIPCADKQKAGICSRLRRVRAAERRKNTERLFHRHSAQRQPPSGWEEGSDDRPGTIEKSGCERLLTRAERVVRCRSAWGWNDDGTRERLLTEQREGGCRGDRGDRLRAAPAAG